MRRFLVLCFVCAATGSASAADWLTLPSTYTHDPHTGERVTQYARPAPAPAPHPAEVSRSLYRHSRSTLQVGQSADNLHRVERYGEPVQPYGEWRFPYRPYSVPYSQWGPPYAGLGFPFPPRRFPRRFGRPGDPRGGDPRDGRGTIPRPGFPFEPYPTDPDGPYPVPPYFDGFYPSYPHRPRLDDEDFFRQPER